MEEKRKRRYRQKIAELEDRLGFLGAKLNDKVGFLADRVLKKAMYKEFQEAVELVSDLAAMAVKDSGKLVGDDYTNLQKACETIEEERLQQDMRRADGLRTVLIHEYKGIKDELAYDSMIALLSSISEFKEGIKGWIKRK